MSFFIFLTLSALATPIETSQFYCDELRAHIEFMQNVHIQTGGQELEVTENPTVTGCENPFHLWFPVNVESKDQSPCYAAYVCMEPRCYRPGMKLNKVGPSSYTCDE